MIPVPASNSHSFVPSALLNARRIPSAAPCITRLPAVASVPPDCPDGSTTRHAAFRSTGFHATSSPRATVAKNFAQSGPAYALSLPRLASLASYLKFLSGAWTSTLLLRAPRKTSPRVGSIAIGFQLCAPLLSGPESTGFIPS